MRDVAAQEYVQITGLRPNAPLGLKISPRGPTIAATSGRDLDRGLNLLVDRRPQINLYLR